MRGQTVRTVHITPRQPECLKTKANQAGVPFTDYARKIPVDIGAREKPLRTQLIVFVVPHQTDKAVDAASAL